MLVRKKSDRYIFCYLPTCCSDCVNLINRIFFFLTSGKNIWSDDDSAAEVDNENLDPVDVHDDAENSDSSNESDAENSSSAADGSDVEESSSDVDSSLSPTVGNNVGSGQNTSERKTVRYLQKAFFLSFVTAYN